ncbi:unnamed protein product [Schistosoma spindalis]|nr:unnamed protein product [Schistosoma spindale]
MNEIIYRKQQLTINTLSSYLALHRPSPSNVLQNINLHRSKLWDLCDRQRLFLFGNQWTFCLHETKNKKVKRIHN